VRLTLRTLLAYLDDTLEPTEIKQIGQKVAESDAAQELIARIKQITRRRRLTTPPLTGPGAANFDPNIVAEYLDNALSGEQIADVEKLCLESDVHLAEIATCHQILTLVLGEPVLVPPTARERMYGLVQGKESIPFRKASTIAPAAVAAGSNSYTDDMDDQPLGLTLLRRGGWPRWVVPAAGLLLIAALVLILVNVMPGSPRGRQQQLAGNDAKVPDAQSDEAAKQPEKEPEKQAPVENKPAAAKADDTAPAKPAENATVAKEPAKEPTKTPAKEPPAATNPGDTTAAAPTTPATALAQRFTAPRTDRKEVGIYKVSARTGPSLLVQRQNDQAQWRRLTPDSPVSSSDQLVSLPGYLSEIRSLAIARTSAAVCARSIDGQLV
jgi:hypothetical protein